MNRREALKSVALIMGGTVVGAQAFLTGCQSQERKDPGVDALSQQSNLNLLNEIGETIIPETDSPGAKAVGIGGFMAMMVRDTYEEKNQKAFRQGLDKIRQDFEGQYDHSFMEGTPEERLAFLNKLNDELEPYAATKKEEDPEHYFRMMKELTLLGYFTSEEGATQALRYVETPGRYDACIPYEKGDRAWAI